MADSLPKKIPGPGLWALLLLVLVLYLPSLKNGYVGWDDDLILNNRLISSLSLQNLSEIFRFTPGASFSIQPLRTLSHALVYAVCGTSPVGYLALNILLYLLNVWLFYIMAGDLLRFYGSGRLRERSGAVSLIAATAFAVHPVHVEAVSWLQGGKQTMMAALIMGSFIFYIRYLQSRKTTAFWASVALYWAGLTTQPGAVSLPLILVCCELLVKQESGRRTVDWRLLFVRMLPFVLPGILMGVHLLFFSSVSRMPGSAAPIFSRIVNVPLLWDAYLFKLLLPVNLCCRYPMSVPLEAPVIQGLGAALLLGVVAYLAWRAAGYSRVALLALVWFAAGCLPTSGLVRISTLMADRYCYLPSLGFSLLLALVVVRLEVVSWPLSRVMSRIVRPAVFILITVALTSWIVITIQRQTDWRNALSLWSRVVQIYPEHSLGNFNLADAYRDSGKLEEAIKHYRRAIKSNPYYAKAYSNLGVCLRTKGLVRQALEMLERARELDPARSEIWVNLGISYANLGRDSLALEAFDKALALGRKGVRTAYYNRAQLLFALGRTDPALADLEMAVYNYPQWMNTEAWLSIGQQLAPLGLVEPAVKLMGRGAEQAAFNAECWRMLGNLHILAARPEEALNALKQADELEPENSETIVLMGVASQQAGKPREAAVFYRKALEGIEKDRPQLLNNLGRALVEAGEPAEAERSFQSALEEAPDYLDARMNLGMLYLESGRKQQAAEQLRKVLELCGDDPELSTIARQARQALDSSGMN
jgi:protein O-mannosyl-transferase